MKTLGQHIIDETIKGGLFTGICAESKDHGVVIVWSSGAAEQLEAIVAGWQPTGLVDPGSGEIDTSKPPEPWKP